MVGEQYEKHKGEELKLPIVNLTAAGTFWGNTGCSLKELLRNCLKGGLVQVFGPCSPFRIISSESVSMPKQFHFSPSIWGLLKVSGKKCNPPNSLCTQSFNHQSTLATLAVTPRYAQHQQHGSAWEPPSLRCQSARWMLQWLHHCHCLMPSVHSETVAKRQKSIKVREKGTKTRIYDISQ